MDEPRLLQKKTTYTIDYPTAIEFANQQMDIFWHPNEIEVEKDLHDMKTNFTEAEYHGVVTTLKLFTLYELVVGNEYWSGKIKKLFPRPDIERMSNCFSFFELNVHAPFYNKLNEVLGLNTDEFYNSYVEDEILFNRINWINKVIAKPSDNIYDILKSLAVFSMIEGAILYSSFAFLKHFQSEGKNKLVNVTAGINFSVRDENLHSMAGAWLFKTLLDESKLSKEEIDNLEQDLLKTIGHINEHEDRIIDMIFEKGNIKGITDHQLKSFIQHRLDLCLEQLGFKKYYNPHYNPIKTWFYKNINAPQLHDFFYKIGNSYKRDWNEKGFAWNVEENV